MNKKQAKKMIRLADYLKTVPRKSFDMWTVITSFNSGNPVKELVKGTCGSTGCMMGHATTIFKNLKAERFCKDEFDVRLVNKNNQFITSGFNDSAQFLFGITFDEAERLFDPNCNDELGDATPKKCAKTLEKFVKEKGYGSLIK